MNLAPSSRTGIGRERATVRAYTTLKQDLLDGVIRPGERIVDTDVCARLGISRTPVREALLALERDRLVRIVPRQGYFASEISVSDALDAYQLRFLLEPATTALAARRISDADLAGLRELLRELSEIEDDDSEDALACAIELNKAFHVRIARASGNGRIAAVTSDLMDALGRLVRVDLRTRASAAATWRVEHRRILAALEARDPDAAAEAVRESFRRDEGLLLARARADLERPATRARDTTGAPAGHHDEGAYG